MNQLRALLLSVIPSITLAIGIGVAEMSGGSGLMAQRDVRAVFAVAAIVPVIAIVVLTLVAPGFDLILVCAAAMLTSLGTTVLLLLASSSVIDSSFYGEIAVRHGLFVGAAFFALMIGTVLARHSDLIRKYPYTLLCVALALTLATMVFGETINGARLWLQLGPVQFQPSEVARLLLAGFIASYLHDRRHLVAAPWRVAAIDLPPAPYLLPLICAVLSAVAVLIFQNDLGMAALVVLGAFATVAGILESKASIGAAGGFLLASAVLSFAVAPRVRDRVAGWLDPWHDPAGRGFQFVQADFSLAAGGVGGSLTATPALSVPEIYTDFVLVGVAGQFGWLGAVAAVSLMAIVVCRCTLAALRANDNFQSLLALSLTALIALQVILIAGGTLRILPLTGLTFPLLSYGGTSMLATMFALGLIVGFGASDADGIRRQL